MADETSALPTSQLVRWMVVGALILAAAGLYFVHGRSLPPLDSAPAAPAAPAAPVVPDTTVAR